MCADTCSIHSGETIEPSSFENGPDFNSFPSTRSQTPSPAPAFREPRMSSPWEAQQIENLQRFRQQALLETVNMAQPGFAPQPWVQQQPASEAPRAAQSQLCQGPELSGYIFYPMGPGVWSAAASQQSSSCFPFTCVPMSVPAAPQPWSGTADNCWAQATTNAGLPMPTETRNMDQKHHRHQEASAFGGRVHKHFQRNRPHLRPQASAAIGLQSGKLSKNAWHVRAAPKECEKLKADLQAGGQRKSEAVGALQQCGSRLAFDPEGCRVLQLALEVSHPSEHEGLVAPLRGRVIDAIVSPYANYVIQKAVSALPAARRGFIIDELRGFAAAAARHRFGCRVLCRLLEYGDHSETRHLMETLIDELLEDVGNLISHSYGHHVIEKLLEHQVVARHAHLVAVTILSDLASLARERHATYVIEAALSKCSPADQCEIVSDLISEAENVHMLATDQFGVHVVRALLKRCDGSSDMVREILWQAPERLQGHKYEEELLGCVQHRPTAEC